MPDWTNEIRRRLASLKLEPASEKELAQHLDDVYQRSLDAGASDAEARQNALRELAVGYGMKLVIAGIVIIEPHIPRQQRNFRRRNP